MTAPTMKRRRFPIPLLPDLREVQRSGTWSIPSTRDVARFLSALVDWIDNQPSTFLDEVTFPAGATPTKNIATTKAPIGVIAIAFDNVSTGSSAQMANALRWSFDQGTLTFTSLAGIAGTDSYRLRFLVLEA